MTASKGVGRGTTGMKLRARVGEDKHLLREPGRDAVRRDNLLADWKFGKPCTEHPEEFFAESNRAQREAAQVCQLLCPVQEKCLDYAIRADERYGVWGGTTERERERLRKKGAQ